MVLGYFVFSFTYLNSGTCMSSIYCYVTSFLPMVNYTVSQKNDNDVLRYNFNAHQPILIIFGRDIAE